MLYMDFVVSLISSPVRCCALCYRKFLLAVINDN
jgi:hypothetical protein